VVLHSYAKLNLYLEVLNKRADGYHNIKTLFERIDLADKITLNPTGSGETTITSNSRLIPKDKKNFAYQAAELLRKEYRISEGLRIHIEKNIPVGAGLAGGSSNAAAVLMGLNKLWNLRLSRSKLAGIAARIGSDVPFFVYDVPFAQACGRGEKISIVNSLKSRRLWHILVVPDFSVSTPLIYRHWDLLKDNKKARLTRPKLGVKILISRLRKKLVLSSNSGLYNGLEIVTANKYPELISIKNKLRGKGIKKRILMSGSGPACFSIVSSRKEAVVRVRQLKDVKSWKVFVTKTC